MICIEVRDLLYYKLVSDLLIFYPPYQINCVKLHRNLMIINESRFGLFGFVITYYMMMRLVWAGNCNDEKQKSELTKLIVTEILESVDKSFPFTMNQKVIIIFFVPTLRFCTQKITTKYKALDSQKFANL